MNPDKTWRYTMGWQGTLYITPLLVAAAFGVVSALYIWRHRRTPAAKTLALIMVAGTGWLLSYVVELLTTSLQVMIFSHKLGYPFLIMSYMGWVVFTLQYVGFEKWVTRRNMLLMSSIPLVTLVLVFTNGYHHLIWSSLVQVKESGFFMIQCYHGPWFWVHAAHSQAMILFGDFLLIYMLIRTRRLYLWQITSLLCAAFLLQVNGVLSYFPLSPLTYFYATAFLFSATALTCTLSIYRFRLADIVPVAWEAVINSMSDGVMVLDPQNRIAQVNPVMERLIGHPASVLNGRLVKEVWSGFEKMGLSVSVTAEEKEVALNIEEKECVYDVRSSPLTDWHGNLVSQIVVLRDMTERVQAEKRLHESEEKFRGIAERNFDAIYELDFEGTITYVSPAVERITDYTPEEVVGNPIHNYITEQSLPEALHALTRVMKGEHLEGVQLELLRKDGSPASVELNSSPIYREGKIVGSQGVVRDITARKRAEIQLKNLFEASKLINSTMDMEKIYQFIANSVQELVGFDNLIIFSVSENRKIYAMYTSEGVKDLRGTSLDYGEGVVGYSIAMKAPLLMGNVPGDRRANPIPGVTEQLVSLVVVPLIIEGECVGALHVSKMVENAYTERDVEALKPLSEIISSAIRNSLLYQEIKEFGQELEKRIEERSKRIEILLNTREVLQKERNWEKGLTTIVESMRNLGFERVGIFLVNPAKETLDYHFGRGIELPEKRISVSLKNSNYFGVKCVLEKKTIHVTAYDPQKGDQIISASSSFVWVPIVVQDEAFAALAADNIGTGSPVLEEDVKELEILASMCGSFIDRTKIQIDPVTEKTLMTEITYWLDPAESYIIIEKKPEKSFEIFVDLVTHGISGFVVSREFPEKIKEKYKLLKTPMLWLSRTEGKNVISPDDLPKMYYIVGEFTRKSKESVILLDGLEYLITQIGFEIVLKHLQELKDTIVLNNSRLIMPVHRRTLSPKEYSILEREFTVLSLAESRTS